MSDSKRQALSQLTIHNCSKFYRAGLETIRSGPAVIDMGAAAIVDSSAVAALVGLQRAARQAGKTLSVINAPAAVVTLAELYGVAELLGFSAKSA